MDKNNTDKNKKSNKKYNIKNIFSDVLGKKKPDETALTKNIDENIQKIKNIFENCYDIIFREFAINAGKTKCFIVYIESSVKVEEINDNILKPLMSIQISNFAENLFNMNWIINYISKSIAPVGQVKELKQLNEITDELLNGSCILFVDQNTTALSLSVEGWELRKSGEAKIESVLRGPAESFVESININTSILRRRIKTPDLKLEEMKLGRISKTSVVMAYINGITDENIVNEVRQRLQNIDIDIIVESGSIEQLIIDEPFFPYPLIESTERPDKTAFALSEGRVVIFVDGTPFVLIVPTVFSHFFISVENSFASILYSPAIIFLRYVAYFLALLAPALFIAATTHHQEMIPFQLLKTLIAARTDLPFPTLFEALAMELTLALLIEAGERLPGSTSTSLSIVGAIVIGQAAIQSGLVSPAMVVIVSASATATFVIPKTNMSRHVRLLKYPFMFLGDFLGIFGITMGGLFLMTAMVSARSFGVPYLSPIAPSNKSDWKSMLLRLPVWLSPKRPVAIQKNNINRISKKTKPTQP